MRTTARLGLVTMSLLPLAAACGPKSDAEKAYAQLHSDSGVDGKSFEEIIGDVRTLSTKYPNLTEVIEYGSSTEGRKLTIMKIWDKQLTVAGRRPAVLISEGIHGNEYLNISDRLPREFIEGQASDSGFKKFLAKGGILYVVPILNPDGYTARQRENGRGQDLNRNFSIKAAGNQGFSEPETKGITTYMAKEAQATGFSLEASMEYHCCIGGLIHPWAYTASPLPKETMDRHVEVGEKMKSIFGYQYGTVREIVGYDAIGGSDDYYLETYGRRAFSFEGAEGSEFRNLSKHVDMWNFVFDLAVASSNTTVGPGGQPGTQPGTQPANPPAATGPSTDLFLAVEKDTSDQLSLLGAAADAFDGFYVCMGGAVACLDPNGTATRIATTQVLASNGRRIFRTSESFAAQTQNAVTLIATKGGKIDAASVTRAVTINKK